MYNRRSISRQPWFDGILQDVITKSISVTNMYFQRCKLRIKIRQEGKIMKEKSKQKKLFMLTGLFMLLLVAGWSLKPNTVKAEVRTFNACGKTFYLESGQYQSLLYRKNGNNYRLVAKSGASFLQYQFSYGNKLYFSRGGEGVSCVTYSYTLGKSGFKKFGPVFLTGHSGKYAVGYYKNLAGDPSPSSLCMVNLSSGRITRLGKGCDIKFMGGKIYYASSVNSYTMQIIRRNANGSGKKVLKTIKTSKKNRLTYVGNITKHSARCYIIGNQWTLKTVRF